MAQMQKAKQTENGVVAEAEEVVTVEVVDAEEPVTEDTPIALESQTDEISVDAVSVDAVSVDAVSTDDENTATDEAAAQAESPEEEPEEEKDEVEELREQLAAAQAQADEYLDRLQRTAAEFQNSKRRQEKKLAESIESASSVIVQRLLPVLDDLDLAFKNVPALEGDAHAWVDGFGQIQKKLLDLLSDESVERMPVDGEFDPNRHEAISSEPSEDVESGHIIETLRAGYERKGRVLRPALVRVAA